MTRRKKVCIKHERLDPCVLYMSLELIDVHASKELIDQGVRLIDIRESEECSEFVAGTEFLPVSALETAKPLAIQAGERVLFYCRSGRRTRLNSERLTDLASPAKLYVMEGGLNQWKAAGLPVVSSASG